MITMYESARQRIRDNAELQPYEDVLLYDWTEGDGHYEWVANAPIDEILLWAMDITKE